MLIPSWIKQREIVWWKYRDGDRVLCKIGTVSAEYLTMYILTATPEQVLHMRRGCGEIVSIQYQDGLLELAIA